MKLKYSYKIFKNITNKISDGVIITNSEGNIVYINQSGLKLFGYKKSEIINKNINDIIATEIIHNSELKNNSRMDIKDAKGIHKNIKEIPIEITFLRLNFNSDVFFGSMINWFFSNNMNLAASPSNENSIFNGIFNLFSTFIESSNIFPSFTILSTLSLEIL